MVIPKQPTKRSIAAKLHAEERRKRKIQAIGERRAAAQGMTRKDFVAAIVRGEYRPITAEDIAAEPEVEVTVEATPEPAAAPAV